MTLQVFETGETPDHVRERWEKVSSILMKRGWTLAYDCHPCTSFTTLIAPDAGHYWAQAYRGCWVDTIISRSRLVRLECRPSGVVAYLYHRRYHHKIAKHVKPKLNYRDSVTFRTSRPNPLHRLIQPDHVDTAADYRPARFTGKRIYPRFGSADMATSLADQICIACGFRAEHGFMPSKTPKSRSVWLNGEINPPPEGMTSLPSAYLFGEPLENSWMPTRPPNYSLTVPFPDSDAPAPTPRKEG